MELTIRTAVDEFPTISFPAADEENAVAATIAAAKSSRSLVRTFAEVFLETAATASQEAGPASTLAHRPPTHSKVRSKVEPRDLPPSKAARRLHLTLEEFRESLPELQTRGFPAPDPTTGMFDLKAIDAWADSRNPRIFKTDVETDKKDARQ